MKLDLKETSAQLILTTCRLEMKYASGAGHATGFLFTEITAQLGDGQSESFPILVTNRHVLEGALSLTTWFHHQDANGTIVPGFASTVHLEPGFTFYHPDSQIDLAAIPFSPFIKAAKAQGAADAVFRALTSEWIPTEAKRQELNAIEEILLIGYPAGLWDEANNLPVARRGITATPLAVDYEGRPEFLIDCACFQGSSGSPVFIFDAGTYATKAAIEVGERVLFLGVLHSVFERRSQGDIKVVPIPTSTVAYAEFKESLHVGVVLRAEHVRELWDVIHVEAKKRRSSESGAGT
jgi:hypothetical protein